MPTREAGTARGIGNGGYIKRWPGAVNKNFQERTQKQNAYDACGGKAIFSPTCGEKTYHDESCQPPDEPPTPKKRDRFHVACYSRVAPALKPLEQRFVTGKDVVETSKERNTRSSHQQYVWDPSCH